MSLNFRTALLAWCAMRTARATTLACLGALLIGCRTAPAPGSQEAHPGKVREASTIPLDERCTLVATIITAAQARVLDATIQVRGTWASRSGGAGLLFAPGERCSGRLSVGASTSEPADGGLAVSIALLDSDQGWYAFNATGAVSLAGQIAKDADGNWRTDGPSSIQRQPRRLDKTPEERELASAVAPGQAEAWFEIDTGGDIMGAPPREAGLAVVFRYAKRELRQVIASCPEAVRGSVLGDIVDPVLDLVGCDGVFRLIRRSSDVIVERDEGDGASATIVTSIPIPPGIREVRGKAS